MFKNFSLSYFNFIAMVIIAILFSFDAFSKVSDGELRQINKRFINTHHPECNLLWKKGSFSKFKNSVGDMMVCSTRVVSSMDSNLNKIYKKVMKRYEHFPKKKNRIKNAQRKWIKYRDKKCTFVDNVDESGFANPSCHAKQIALSIWYLKRLNSIQFDRQGFPLINSVIKEYSQRLTNS